MGPRSAVVCVLGALAGVAAETQACSCQHVDSDSLEFKVAWEVRRSSLIARALVESTEPVSPYFSQQQTDRGRRRVQRYEAERAHLKTLEVFQGAPGKQFISQQSNAGASCGFNFEEGKEYLVYLSGPFADGRYAASMCSRTRIVTERTRREIEILRSMKHARESE